MLVTSSRETTTSLRCCPRFHAFQLRARCPARRFIAERSIVPGLHVSWLPSSTSSFGRGLLKRNRTCVMAAKPPKVHSVSHTRRKSFAKPGVLPFTNAQIAKHSPAAHPHNQNIKNPPERER